MFFERGVIAVSEKTQAVSGLPPCFFKGGDKSCLSGCCIAPPCCDSYAPHWMPCCCFPPMYNDEFFDLDEFYDKVMPNLHTGDLFLSSWPSDDDTRNERCMVHSRWTHAGMIYRRSDAPDILQTRPKPTGNNNLHNPISRPLVAEMANPEEGFLLSDFEYDVRSSMVECDQEEYLQSRRDNPDSENPRWLACVRFLNVERDEQFYHSIEKTIQHYYNMPYRLDESEEVMAAVGCFKACPCSQWSDYDDPNTSFCSEFVATAYRDAGIISAKSNPALFTPSHFGSTRSMVLQNGASLSKEYVVSMTSLEDLSRHKESFWNANYNAERPDLLPGEDGEIDEGEDKPQQMQMDYKSLQ